PRRSRGIPTTDVRRTAMGHGRNVRTLGLVIALGGAGLAQVTTRISVTTSGAGANDRSERPAISDDGRSIAFESEASNLIASDTDGHQDIFCRDWTTNSNAIVSVDTAGNLPDSMCFGPKISADGRYVAFASAATNLVPGDTNGQVDVFVRDRSSGTTQRVSVSSAVAQADFGSTIPAISADGRYVVFESFATNLVPGDTNGLTDVFLRDRQTGITERISVTTFEAQANGASRTPAVSADGR